MLSLRALSLIHIFEGEALDIIVGNKPLLIDKKDKKKDEKEAGKEAVKAGVLAVSYTHLDVYKRQIQNTSDSKVTSG